MRDKAHWQAIGLDISHHIWPDMRYCKHRLYVHLQAIEWHLDKWAGREQGTYTQRMRYDLAGK